MNKKFRREVACLGISDTNFVSLTTSNSPGAVEFDFFRVWEYYKENKDKVKEIIMLHTHPPGFDVMSSIDANMLDGWKKAFKGVDILCAIVQPNSYRGYMHDNRTSVINENEFRILESQTSTILNYLSYKDEDVGEEELKVFEKLICQLVTHLESS